MLSFSQMARKVEKLCKESSFYDSKYVGNLVGMWREREIMPREFFGNPKLYQFERCHFYGVENRTNIFLMYMEIGASFHLLKSRNLIILIYA